MFFWSSVAFLMIQRMLEIWLLVLLPFLKPAPSWTSGSSQFTYCWSLACRILSITLLACEIIAIVILKSRDITLPTKGHLVKAMVYPVVMYGCESWTIKKVEHWRIDAFELWCWRRLLRVPWTARRSKPVHPKGDQSWLFIGRTAAEAESPILWPPDVKNWLIWKDPDGGKDWRQEEKGMTEDETVGWHHQLNGHEFE